MEEVTSMTSCTAVMVTSPRMRLSDFADSAGFILVL